LTFQRLVERRLNFLEGFLGAEQAGRFWGLLLRLFYLEASGLELGDHPGIFVGGGAACGGLPAGPFAASLSGVAARAPVCVGSAAAALGSLSSGSSCSGCRRPARPPRVLLVAAAGRLWRPLCRLRFLDIAGGPRLPAEAFPYLIGENSAVEAPFAAFAIGISLPWLRHFLCGVVAIKEATRDDGVYSGFGPLSAVSAVESWRSFPS